MANTNFGGGCCGTTWDCSAPGQQSSIAMNPAFDLGSPLGACVPGTVSKNLPEFLKWFGEFGTPILCKMQELQTSNCSVITGVGGFLTIKSINDLVKDCIADNAEDCATFIAKLTGPTACIPDKTSETAVLVLSRNVGETAMAWRSAPALDCATLTAFLKPNPISTGSCFTDSTLTPTKLFAVLPNGDLGWVVPPASTTSTATPTCLDVKNALEGGCVTTGLITSSIGFDAQGYVVKEVERKLIRMTYQGLLTVRDPYTATLLDHANSVNRRVWRWNDVDSTIAALSPGQIAGDLTYDAINHDVVIGHAGTYTFTAGILLSLEVPVTAPASTMSILAGFRIERPVLGAYELRFGEATIHLPATGVTDPNSDFFFNGEVTVYMPAGSKFRVRYWAAPGSGSSGLTVKLSGDYSTNSYLMVTEQPVYA